MINLKSILWLLPLSLLVSPLLYGENLPDKWYKGTIQATAIELQQVGIPYIFKCFMTLIK